MSIPVLSSLDFGGSARVLALPEPVAAQEPSTKNYVDTAGASGNTTVDFGPWPGTDLASTVITGQASIPSGAKVRAWIYPLDTPDHSLDEHTVEQIQVFAHSVVAGVGLTITAISGSSGGLRGLWSVGFEWSR